MQTLSMISYEIISLIPIYYSSIGNFDSLEDLIHWIRNYDLWIVNLLSNLLHDTFWFQKGELDICNTELHLGSEEMHICITVP